MSTETFDAVVIGTGQAGKPLATALAKAGRKTAIIERQHVGGSCINFGCTPTKTMVASARVAHLARRGPEYGVRTGTVTVDLHTVRERKRSIVDMFRRGGERGLEKTDGVELVRGHGRFTGPRSVEVELTGGGTRTLDGDAIFINTGTRAAVPPVEGLAGPTAVPFLDNTTVMELDRVPEHLLVLGGGYIGVELGQMFRRFGAEVTIVQRGDQLLPGQDPDVAEELREILEEDGVAVHLDTEATAARERDGGVVLDTDGPGGGRELAGSHLLVATGRRPNTDDLGLDDAGVATDRRGFVQVDARLRTTADGVYALGDVHGGPAFTHMSYDDFRIIRANLLEGGDRTTEGRLVPFTLFTDPQLGRVGMTEQEARRWAQETRRTVRVAKLPMSHVARALETDETRGFMKAVVDGETGRILGCAILGIEGGEVMAVLQTAMLGDLPYTAIREGIFAHPTLAESLNNLFMTLED